MPAISSGTTCFFHQNTAPVGWTKLTDIDDHGLRVTTTWAAGSQGNTSAGTTQPFNTIFSATKPVTTSFNPTSSSSQPTTITDASTPPHVHKGPANGNVTVSASAPGTVAIRNAPPGATAFPMTALQPVSADATSVVGVDGHAHPMSLSTASVSSSMAYGIRYVDVIRATRD